MAARKRRSGKWYSRGSWEVERERHRLPDRSPTAGVAEPLPLDGLVQRAMKQLGLDRQHLLESLSQAWPQVVGPDVAAHSRPGRVEENVFTIFVDSSAWLSELSRYAQGRILNNVRHHPGADRIKSINLLLDPDAGTRPKASGFLERWKKDHPDRA